MTEPKKKYTRRFHIGIDIGKEGAIVIQEKDKLTNIYKMPLIGKELDMLELYNILMPYEAGNGMVIFEKIVPFTANKSAMYSLGHQAGAIEMVCVALAIPFTKVPPQTWQKEMFTGVDQATKKSTTTKSGVSRDTKSMALVAAKRLFPEATLKFGQRTTVPHNGLVDALLMSEYGRRKYQ
jgi:hypothetical protein